MGTSGSQYHTLFLDPVIKQGSVDWSPYLGNNSKRVSGNIRHWEQSKCSTDPVCSIQNERRAHGASPLFQSLTYEGKWLWPLQEASNCPYILSIYWASDVMPQSGFHHSVGPLPTWRESFSTVCMEEQCKNYSWTIDVISKKGSLEYSCGCALGLHRARLQLFLYKPELTSPGMRRNADLQHRYQQKGREMPMATNGDIY